MKCQSGLCRSPIACEGFGYCRELNEAKSFHDGKVTLHAGDCLDVLGTLPENSVDAVVTDPPYHLTSIVKRFGGANAAPAKGNEAFIRASRGFMGKQWDGGDVAFRPELWAEVLRVLKPGGHMVCFGGTRTYHRMVCAIEDAGFEVRDQLAWVYGSGFPKSHDVSKGIDRRQDYVRFPDFAKHYAERRKAAGLTHAQVCALGPFYGAVNHGGMSTNWESGLSLPTVEQWNIIAPVLGLPQELYVSIQREEIGSRKVHKGVAFTSSGPDELPITLPATDAARQWQGWGTALKPSFEPILFGSKPVTVEQHFAIIVAELNAILFEVAQCLNVTVSDVEQRFYAIQAKSEEAASSVLANAKIRSLESIGLALSVEGSSTSNALASIDLIKTKECSALSHVRQNGRPDKTQGTRILAGEAVDILTRIMDMSTSAMVEGISESIVKSWLNVSGDLLSAASKFTIETASRLTIALRTWSYSLLPSTIGGTGGLSPNLSPICLARKPLSEGTVAANVLKHGVGALNIDATRIAHQSEADRASATPGGKVTGKSGSLAGKTQFKGCDDYAPDTLNPVDADTDICTNCYLRAADHRPRGEFQRPDTSLGRWPANLCHDGSAEVLAGFPNGESRYFYTSKANYDDRLNSKHPTVKPVDLMQWLVRLVCPKGATVLDPFAGTGTTGEAAFREGCKAVLIEREAEYLADIERRMEMLLSGPDERARKLAKSEPYETLPLFA